MALPKKAVIKPSPPIFLHITELRPKQCDIAWNPPIVLPDQQSLINIVGYEIQLFNLDDFNEIPIQKYQLKSTHAQINNLYPNKHYEIWIYTLSPNSNTYSTEAEKITFYTPSRSKLRKKIIPDPPEEAQEIDKYDYKLRNKIYQLNNIIISWKTPRRFRGRILYKILWKNDLLGVTNKCFIDLGDINDVKNKFQYMHQQKRINSNPNYDDDDDDDDMDDDDDESYDNDDMDVMDDDDMLNNNDFNDFDDNDDDDADNDDDDNDIQFKPNHRKHNIPAPLNEIKLILKSQTTYKGPKQESHIDCDFTIKSIFDPSNKHLLTDYNKNELIKWNGMYNHDRNVEQIVVWFHLEAKSSALWELQPQDNEHRNIQLTLASPNAANRIDNNSINATQQNTSLYVTVWKKPFSHHLNNFFSIATRYNNNNQNNNNNDQKQNEKDDKLFSNLDCFPKPDPQMNAYFIRAKQRAIVIEYSKRTNLFKNMFGGNDERREHIFILILHTMLNWMKDDELCNDDDDDNDNDNSSTNVFTLHDCNATISWIVENGEWIKNNQYKKESLCKILTNEFDRKLCYMLGHEWNNDEYNDKNMKLLLLMMYWLLKILKNNFRSNWFVGIINKLSIYIKIYNKNHKNNKITIFNYLNHVYGTNLISYSLISKIAQYMIPGIRGIQLRNFLPALLWYNVLYQCIINIPTIKGHDQEVTAATKLFKQIDLHNLLTEIAYFQKIININDQFCYGMNNQSKIEIRNTFFKVLFNSNDNWNKFIKYLHNLYQKQTQSSFCKILNQYTINIEKFLGNQYKLWRRYMIMIYKLLKIHADNKNNKKQLKPLTKEQKNIIHSAFQAIYRMIPEIVDKNGANELYLLINEMPLNYDKTNILYCILHHPKDYLLFNFPEKYLNYIVKVLLLRNNNKLTNKVPSIIVIPITYPVNDTLTIKTYQKYAQYKIELSIHHWILANSIKDAGKKYAIKLICDYNIPWDIFANVISSKICNEVKQSSINKGWTREYISMKIFIKIIKYISDKTIPKNGRKSIIPKLVSFWRESPKNKWESLNLLFQTMFSLLFCGNDESSLYNIIRKEFHKITPYLHYFNGTIFDENNNTTTSTNNSNNNLKIPLIGRKQTFNPLQSDAEIEYNIKKQKKKKKKQKNKLNTSNFDNKIDYNDDNDNDNDIDDNDDKNRDIDQLISIHFLRCAAVECKLILNQESFYRFNKKLSAFDNPFRLKLLEKRSGVYYLMSILMNRLNDIKKSEFYLNKSINLINSKQDRLRAYFLTDIALIYFNNDKQKEAIKKSGNACDLCSESYIKLINSIINGKEKYVDHIINSMDKYKNNKNNNNNNNNNNNSYFARFLYAQYLAKKGQIDNSKNQFDIIIKQFAQNNDNNSSFNVINGGLYYEYGNLLLNNKQNDSAIKQYENALKTQPCAPNIKLNSITNLKKLKGDKFNITKYNILNYNNNNNNNNIVGINNSDNDDEKDDNKNNDDLNDINNINIDDIIHSETDEESFQPPQKKIPLTGGSAPSGGMTLDNP